MPHIVWLVDRDVNLAMDLSSGWPYALQGYAPKAGRRHLILRGDPALQAGQDLVAGKFLNVDETIVLAARDGDKGIQWGSPEVRTQQPVPVKITDPNWFVLVWKYGIKNYYGGIIIIYRPNGQARAFAAEAPSNNFYVGVTDTTGTQTGTVSVGQNNWPGQGVWMLVGIAKIDGQYYVVHSHAPGSPLGGPLPPPTQESENFVIGIGTAGANNIWVGGALFGAFKLTPELVQRIAALGYQNAIAFNPDVWPGPPYDFYWPLVEDLRGRPFNDNPMVVSGSGNVTFSSPYPVPRWPERIRALQATLERGVILQEHGRSSPLALAFLPQGSPKSRIALSPVVHGQVSTPDDLLGWKAVTGQVYDIRVDISRKPYFEETATTLSTSVTNGSAKLAIGPIDSPLPPAIDINLNMPLGNFYTVLALQNDGTNGFYELTGTNYGSPGTTTEVSDTSASGGTYIWFNGTYASSFVVDFTADKLRWLNANGGWAWFVIRMWDVTNPTIRISRKLGNSFFYVGPELRMIRLGDTLWISEGPLPLATGSLVDARVIVNNIQGGKVDCFIWGANLARWVTGGGSDLFDTTSPVWRRLTPLTVLPGATLFFAWSRGSTGWWVPTLGGSLTVTYRRRRLGT